MTKENKIAFSIFLLFFIYGIQGYFTLNAFVVPTFLFKGFYLLFVLILFGLYLKASWNLDSSSEVLDNEIKELNAYKKNLFLLLGLSVAWAISDIRFIAFIFSLFGEFNVEIIFSSTKILGGSLVMFSFCLMVLLIKVSMSNKFNFVSAGIIALAAFWIISQIFWDENVQNITVITLTVLIHFKLITHKSIRKVDFQPITAFFNLVVLLQSLTYFLPA